MVGLKMTFLDPALFLIGQFTEHLSQMVAPALVQNLPASLRDENNVILALPFRVA
jgi:hypothetical protein